MAMTLRITAKWVDVKPRPVRGRRGRLVPAPRRANALVWLWGCAVCYAAYAWAVLRDVLREYGNTTDRDGAALLAPHNGWVFWPE